MREDGAIQGVSAPRHIKHAASTLPDFTNGTTQVGAVLTGGICNERGYTRQAKHLPLCLSIAVNRRAMPYRVTSPADRVCHCGAVGIGTCEHRPIDRARRMKIQHRVNRALRHRTDHTLQASLMINGSHGRTRQAGSRGFSATENAYYRGFAS